MVDANVVVGALISPSCHNRDVLRACFRDRIHPIVGETLFREYEDVLSRDSLFTGSPLSGPERKRLFEAFLSVCKWTQVYYLWRSNLTDEADNHLIELAVAGSADLIVTNNVRHFRHSELRFPAIRIIDPARLHKELQ